jgi:epoxyqueuosine reductase
MEDKPDLALTEAIRAWGADLGLRVGFATLDLSHAEAGLMAWLGEGFHGEMDYMARHGLLRARPRDLLPGAVMAIQARLDYWPSGLASSESVLTEPATAYISRYALGRDYHKVLRGKLQSLAERIEQAVGPFRYRAFTDSAPILEVELASLAGLGWRGKHTLLLSRDAGSTFFLGELLVDLPLAADQPVSAHCGSCSRCLDACPTGAIVAPYRLDARRCISYLTIEHQGPIPLEFRAAMGNRIYGCDDCQLVCPWNRYAQPTQVPDFAVRHGLDRVALLELWAWSEDTFLANMAGSAIRRIGYERWRRNLAIAMGNAGSWAVQNGDAGVSASIRAALLAALPHASELVREHIEWALRRAASEPI